MDESRAVEELIISKKVVLLYIYIDMFSLKYNSQYEIYEMRHKRSLNKIDN